MTKNHDQVQMTPKTSPTDTMGKKEIGSDARGSIATSTVTRTLSRRNHTPLDSA